MCSCVLNLFQSKIHKPIHIIFQLSFFPSVPTSTDDVLSWHNSTENDGGCVFCLSENCILRLIGGVAVWILQSVEFNLLATTTTSHFKMVPSVQKLYSEQRLPSLDPRLDPGKTSSGFSSEKQP